MALRLPDVIGAYDDTHRLFAYWWWIVLHLDEGFAPLSIGQADVNVPLAVVFGDDVAATKRERWRRVPGWLAVTCVRDDDPVTAQEDYGACACAIHNLSLYLHSAGVESKWTSGAVTRETRFLEMLGADPAREYCVGLIWYGYPKRRPRTQRRDLGVIVFSCP